MPDAARILRRCIERCARHRDGRGPWQAERACAASLGGSPIDRASAAAAARLGVWLGSISAPPTAGVGRDCARTDAAAPTPTAWLAKNDSMGGRTA